jgi:4-hydroxy-tetrahydrodipicolinate reductase
LNFHLPEVAYENIKACLENKIPVICGTTGWLEKKLKLKNWL